jgi:hypothetical protein
MDRVVDLLAELSVDPYRRDAFVSAPDAVMTEAGLSPSERAFMDPDPPDTAQ